MKRFQRPINDYTGSQDLLYREKYQQDSKSVPKIAISSVKMDGDFNYLVDAVNTLDEDVKSVVHSGISNETILEKHVSVKAISETKLADLAVSSRVIAEGAVSNAKLTDLAVTTPKLANNSVTKDKMASASVGKDELLDGSVTKDKLAPDAISDSVPVGTIARFSVASLPTGWLLCNGSTLSKNTYPQLVKFLTNSDVTLEATLPDLNKDESTDVKSAIKAFSDVAELATLEIAGLTQDVANNNAEIAKKADKLSAPIAYAEVGSNGVIINSSGIKTATRNSTGKYTLYLADNVECEEFNVMAISTAWGSIRYLAKNYVAKYFTLSSQTWNGNVEKDATFTVYVYARKGEE